MDRIWDQNWLVCSGWKSSFLSTKRPLHSNLGWKKLLLFQPGAADGLAIDIPLTNMLWTRLKSFFGGIGDLLCWETAYKLMWWYLLICLVCTNRLGYCDEHGPRTCLRGFVVGFEVKMFCFVRMFLVHMGYIIFCLYCKCGNPKPLEKLLEKVLWVQPRPTAAGDGEAARPAPLLPGPRVATDLLYRRLRHT